MAEKKEHKSKTKAPKKRLKGITHHKAEGGGFVHEHHFEDGTSNFAGFSPDLADVHQHIDDHLGPEAEAAEQEPEAAAAGGAPGGAAPGGGAMPGE